MISLPRSLMLFSGILLGSLMVGQAQSKEPEVQNLSTLLPSDTPIYLRINEPAKLFLDEFRNPIFLNALKNIPQIGGQLENQPGP